MRSALVASLVFHACALALLPWSSGGRTRTAPVRFVSAAIEQPASIEPRSPEPIEAEAEPLPRESYDLPRPEPVPELDPLPPMPGILAQRRSALPGHYRLKKPLTLRRAPKPPAQVVADPAPAAPAPPLPALAAPAPAPPRLVKGSQVPPRYPPLARRCAWQGTVVLELTISATGTVEKVVLRKSSGFALLDREAMRVARQWRYKPGTRNGRVTRATLLQPVEFRLH